MAGNAISKRERVGVLMVLAAIVFLVLSLLLGVSEDVGDRIVAPLGFGAIAIGLAITSRRLRSLAVIIGAGVPLGIMLGMALRLAMFIAALMGGGRDRTLAGTAVLLLLSIMLATTFSAVVAIVRKLISVRPFYLGTLTLLLGTLPLLLASDNELRERGVLAVNVLTFALTFFAFGWLLAVWQPRIEAWWDRRAAARHRGVADAPTGNSVIA